MCVCVSAGSVFCSAAVKREEIVVSNVKVNEKVRQTIRDHC